MRLRAVVVLVVSLACVWVQPAAAQVVDGRLGPGALYRLVRPPNWNGELLLYAHGFVSNAEPVALPAEADLITGIATAQGFAVAFSSFSENGWAVKDGAQRTHQLLGIFRSKFGAPSRVYIGGTSMGSLIAIKLIEEHPGAFDGVLAACAPAGGARLQADYQANVRALFDVFYPGVLPGDAGSVPPVTDVNADIAIPAAAAMQANPSGAFAIASISQTPVPFASAAELGNSIVTALVGHAESVIDLLPELHGQPYFDNRNTQYTGALPALQLAHINETIERFDASPSALNYLDHYYQPSGALPVPMVMLSTSRDPLVPGVHQVTYAQLVTAAGQSDLLFQRTIDRYGHCAFTPTEIATSFADLVGWVEFGIAPQP